LIFNYFILRFDCFYINPAYKDTPVFFVFVGILMTGVFMLNYEFVPAWDSNYGMMMSQNIPMKQYLNSKAVLMSVSVLIWRF
jgi:hypothetical protein